MSLLWQAYSRLQELLEQGEAARDRHAAALRAIAAAQTILHDRTVLYIDGTQLYPYVADRMQLAGRIAQLYTTRNYAALDDQRALRAYQSERSRYMVEARNIFGGAQLTASANKDCPGFPERGKAPDAKHDPRLLENATFVSCQPEAGMLLLKDEFGTERQAHAIVVQGNGADRYAVTPGVTIQSIAYPELGHL